MPQGTVLRGQKIEAPPEIGTRQHALVTIAQLRAAGVSDSAVAKRVKRGVLHREYRGVYSLARPLSRKAQLLAPVLAAGPGSFLSLWAAPRCTGSFAAPRTGSTSSRPARGCSRSTCTPIAGSIPAM